jgi:hypothetical protein
VSNQNGKPQPAKPFFWLTRVTGFASPRELSDCAAVYHEAGRSLYNSLRNPSIIESLDGYPMVFLYRQAIELYIKALLEECGPDLHLDTKGIDKQHNLCKLLPGLTLISDRMGERISNRSVGSICELNDVDPGSTAFRYNSDRIERAFDIAHFHTEMELVVEEISGLLKTQRQEKYAEIEHAETPAESLLPPSEK